MLMEHSANSVVALTTLLASLYVVTGCSSSSDNGDPGGGVVVDDAGAGGSGSGTGTDSGTDTATGTGTDTGTDVAGGSDSETLVFTSAVAVTGETIYYGYLTIDQPDPGAFDDGDVSAGFLKTNISLPAGDLAAAYRPAFDTCEVTTTETDIGDIPDIDIDFAYEFVSAGENIVLTSPAGTWLTLPRQQAFGFLFYGFLEDTEIPAPVPSGLTVDIPGDEFPAYTGVAVPDVAALTGVSTGAGMITPDTVFRWDAGDNADVSVSIDVVATSFSGTNISFTTVDCEAADDGEFSFPAATRTELGSGFSAATASLSRTGINFFRKGNSLLIVSNSSSSVPEAPPSR